MGVDQLITGNDAQNPVVASLETDRVQNIEYINEIADLPTPSGGAHPLNDSTAYWFNGFITSPDSLQLGNPSPLIAAHGSLDGFIHTGGGDAITGTDKGLFMRNMYCHAPGGTIFNLTANQSTEMLVESCSFSDAAALGTIASLGTIDGYRVPSFKGTNFEQFDGGLTFTGTPEKVFFEGCPLRTISGSSVTIVTFDSAFTTDIVDMTDCYVKGVQSDTVVIAVDASATINDIFQYRGTTHDSTVTQSNILTDAAGVDIVGYRVRDSYPLEDSKAFIDYTLDSETTTTISTQAASKTDAADYVKIAGTTSLKDSARFTHADNSATYDGRRTRVANLVATVSVGTETNDVVAVAWFRNGNLVDGTATRIQMSQQGGGVAKSTTANGVDSDMETDDEFDVRVANLGSTTNITVGELAAKITT